MERKWHIEHADGSEWDSEDLRQWALDHPESMLVYSDIEGFFINEYGELVILDVCGNWYPPNTDDMVLVWDQGEVA